MSYCDEIVPLVKPIALEYIDNKYLTREEMVTAILDYMTFSLNFDESLEDYGETESKKSTHNHELEFFLKVMRKINNIVNHYIDNQLLNTEEIVFLTIWSVSLEVAFHLM